MSFATLQDCSAGDSAIYERRNGMLDDVVIVEALRTPLTKVRSNGRPPCMHLHALMWRASAGLQSSTAYCRSPS